MNTRFLKSIAAFVLIVTLAFSLTGCDGLDYRDAIDLYNLGQYDEAAEMFSALGDFEDSKAMHTRSLYWAAVTLMEQGDFRAALPRFIKLGDYEDSALRVTECNYQIAMAAFESGNLDEAQNQFQELADYRQTQEYLRQINWQKLYDAIGEYPIEKELDGKNFSIFADPAYDTLVLSVMASTNEPFSYIDELCITLTRDSTVAIFEASSDFGMNFGDTRIGSAQSASGRLDITTCTPETPLVIETFSKQVEDNQGNTTESADPADSLMNETMAENMRDLMTVIPELLRQADIEMTLNDIGFEAM